MYVGLTFMPNILVLCASQLAGKAVYWLRIRHNVRQHVPEAAVDLRAVSWSTLTRMFQYGKKNVVMDVAWLLVNRKDVMLTTAFWGSQWVPTYSFARILVASISDLCSYITQPIRPNLIYHWARNEYEAAYTIYYTIARYSAFPVLLAAAFLGVFGTDFLRLWIGPRFVSGLWWFRADVVLFFLLAAQVPRALHSVSWQLLQATDKHRSLSILIVIEAICNLALAFRLIRYGTVGLAIALFIPMFLSHVVVLPILLRRFVGFSMQRYVIEGVGRPILVAAVVTMVGVALYAWNPPNSWPSLLFDGASMAAIGLLLGVAFVLRPVDRGSIIGRLRSMMARKNAVGASV
jgi:O-antigen/teichoic acid export membrane protein